MKLTPFALLLAVMSLPLTPTDHAAAAEKQKAYFGSGCFWCTEAIYERVDGVTDVRSGFSGGKTENPTYKEVVSGKTGHAEVIEVTYDPAQVSYERLLDVFFDTHDPTTLNRQGNDVGTQYRSIVLYQTEEEKQKAEAAKEKFNGVYRDPVVTQIVPFKQFYVAENYHQDYFELNGRQPYCALVIAPKVKKFEAKQAKEKAKAAK